MIIGKHEDDVGPFASYRTWEKKESKAAKGEEGMVHDEPSRADHVALDKRGGPSLCEQGGSSVIRRVAW